MQNGQIKIEEMFKETLSANEADGILRGTKTKVPENMFF